MAFQMIPPRVSSSPPPLDSIPTVACTGEEDDEDEFGSFATHNTFDITGLSDKLPPTPECSPSKILNTTSSKEADISAILGANPKDLVGGSNLEDGKEATSSRNANNEDCSEFSIPVCSSDINGKHGCASEIEDVDEFGDFSCFTSVSDTQVDEKCDQIGGIESSHLTTHTGDKSPSNSAKSFSMIATPPPLDHIADNIIIDDEFSRISPNPPVIEEDDDFGDFATGILSTSDNTKVGFATPSSDAGVNKLTVDSASESVPDVGRHLDILEEDKTNESSNDSDSCLPKHVHCDPSNESESIGEVARGDLTGEVDRDRTNLVDESNVGEDSKQFHPSNKDTVPNKQSIDNGVSSSVISGEASSNSLPDSGQGVCGDISRSNDVDSRVAQNLGLDSFDVSEQYESKVDHSVEKQSVGSACINSRSKESGFDSNSVIGTADIDSGIVTLDKDNRTEDNTCNQSQVVSDVPVNEDLQSGVDRASYIHDEELDGSDSEFGHFDKAPEDDDLDFGDLQEQVCSGNFGSGDDAGDDFGDFYEYNSAYMGPPPISDDKDDRQSGSFENAPTKDDDDFGDFATGDAGDDFGDFATGEATDDFGDFTTGDAGDDFGDFTAGENEEGFGNFASTKALETEKEVAFDDDDFGDFNQSSPAVTTESFEVTWSDAGSSALNLPKDTSRLSKLETLMLKWIPKDSSSVHQENQMVPTLFQCVEDDAFVWRQLENLESSAALTLSWGNTQAQTLYLSSVNVDARNILFGQKWSSSVPLFAQTLSFSPLTPAKPPENGSTAEGGLRSSVTPPILSSTLSPKFNTSFNREDKEVEIPTVNENDSEEQIPPAKFDWTSSGLTNPLEGPSLEREFLSESGEKGTVGGIKLPPAPSPLVQQILGSGLNSAPSTTTPLHSLSTDIREAVEHLPKIGFMRSRVLMFPIRGDE